MIGNDPLFVGRNDLVLFLQTADHPVDGILEVFHFNRFLAFTGRDQRCFVTDIGDIRAGKTRCLFRQFVNIELAGYLDRLQVHLEDRFSAFQIRFVDRDLAVETTGTQQRGIEYIRTVGGSQHDDAAVASKAIHFHEQLVERAFPLVIAHNGILTPGATDGVDLIDKNDTGRFFPRLFEQVADPAGAYSHEQFDKVGTAHREERNLGFAGHRLCQQGLTGTRRTDQQARLSGSYRQVPYIF